MRSKLLHDSYGPGGDLPQVQKSVKMDQDPIDFSRMVKAALKADDPKETMANYQPIDFPKMTMGEQTYNVADGSTGNATGEESASKKQRTGTSNDQGTLLQVKSETSADTAHNSDAVDAKMDDSACTKDVTTAKMEVDMDAVPKPFTFNIDNLLEVRRGYNPKRKFDNMNKLCDTWVQDLYEIDNDPENRI